MQARLEAHTEADDLEERSVAELTDRFGHRVRFFAFRVERRFGLDSQWRDDLISSGYWGLLKALRNRRGCAHDRELSAYVSKRVEGAVIDEARRVLSRLSNQDDGDPSELDAAESAICPDYGWELGLVPEDPEQLTDRAHRWRDIESALSKLDEPHQELIWAYIEGRSISEIARSQGDSTARVQGQLNRIARQIRAGSPELRRLLRYEV
jgi:RNA polymerase sigma factor (sigma-70 family)